jgi:hypothetical protein
MMTEASLRSVRKRRRRAFSSSLSRLGFSAALLLVATGEGEAHHKHRTRLSAPQYPQEFPWQKYYRWEEYYQNQAPWLNYYRGPRPCMSLDDCDRKAYGESGTRGRMGLGADPAHPEGPGNVSD